MRQILLLAAVFLCGCSQTLIKDKDVRAKIGERLEQRKSWIPPIPADATASEKEALEFIYAYMPMGDAADFSSDLYLKNVRATLTAKKEMGWSVPENIFLHFVLPIRVNNENLDTSREDFYAELKDRIKGLKMTDAILEVNHWCHEKVVYTPSDGRTMSPSALIRNAQGRCGEESTFTVAALRSVGIPARQVYTPRWAHSDDNHAWVEAWADGKWYYMGACEPEPVLNTGWFDSPAARALLMHTKVYGDYNGDEEVINRTECYTEINVTKNYAEVALAEVQVVDTGGKPVAGAGVDFGIYNYAEFFPAARKVANEEGKTSISAGLGTMVVWANDGTNYGFAQLNFGQDKSIKVVLDNKSGEFPIDVVPPVEKTVIREITPEQRATNGVLLAREDSIRNAYVATFATEADGEALAAEIGADPGLVKKYLVLSRGNHVEITKFLKETPKDQIGVALELLGVIADKDVRDTPASVLRDHLNGAFQYKDEPHFVRYILNPRVRMELLTPYRARLSEVGGCTTVDELISSTKDIKIVPELNPAELRITPLGVHNSRMADQAAFEVYTIALLRSKGVPARHEPITDNLQYFEKTSDKWVNITTAKVAEKGTLNLTYKDKDDPKYSTHFTLSKLNNGVFKGLNMRAARGSADMGGGNTRSGIFGKPLPLEEGTYRLTSGTRLANGSVLADVKIFTIEAGKETSVELLMRKDETKVAVIGNITPEHPIFVKSNATEAGTILQTSGRGYFIFAMVGAKQEPTNHAMRDLAGLKDYLEKWNRSIVLVFKNKEEMGKFEPKEFGNLPKTVSLGYDYNGETLKMLQDMMKDMKVEPNTDNLPIFIIADTFGRVVFFSQGYKIGLGEQMKKVIENL